MSTPRILISAFEPFAGETLNSSMALVEALAAEDIKGVELHTL